MDLRCHLLVTVGEQYFGQRRTKPRYAHQIWNIYQSSDNALVGRFNLHGVEFREGTEPITPSVEQREIGRTLIDQSSQ
jgi:hypothetical protein